MSDPDLLTFYRERIRNHGLSYAAMWGDKADWKSAERFRPLLQLPLRSGDVLVDIGCGTADLALFLKSANVDVEYVGVEAVPEFAAAAREASGCEIIEIDAFKNPDRLPAGDWYVTFGTLNKSWSVADLQGESDSARVLGLLQRLYGRSRKGMACSLVTSLVEYAKPGVINMDPVEVAAFLGSLSPHFSLFHGYPFYEFFAAAWRDERR